MNTLRNHVEMIDLNPLVIERFIVKAPSFASPEEYHAVWYEIVDRITYLPGGLAKGNVHYNACFHDLAEGLQTHVYAPMGLDIRSRWTMGGNLPGEPAAPVEMGLGIPRQGLYLREDVQMKCNIVMTNFVKKTLKRAHSSLVDRLVEKAKIVEVGKSNASLGYAAPNRQSTISSSSYSGSQPGTPSLAAVSPGTHHSRLSVGSDQGYPPRVTSGFVSPGMIQDPAYAAQAAQHGNPAYPYPPGAYGHPGYAYPSPPQGGPPHVPEKDHKGQPNQAVPGYVELPSSNPGRNHGPLELPG
jgi:hypothetical protein